ncbi:hypothetical protein K458DRAFT_489444 [Lentithecium fluviatile CBS 122367]|uniref:Uncharacterized protein n=1 Tax=Lentithecium fluviatile CBS 122367 TaxID=1168545 RepID=A0A6G1ISV5_9PLEO|nr:hypothetical protein K458DRAFT_489444 [Lentithecium fluviatile CBS 122367]
MAKPELPSCGRLRINPSVRRTPEDRRCRDLIPLQRFEAVISGHVWGATRGRYAAENWACGRGAGETIAPKGGRPKPNAHQPPFGRRRSVLPRARTQVGAPDIVVGANFKVTAATQLYPPELPDTKERVHHQPWRQQANLPASEGRRKAVAAANKARCATNAAHQ